MTKCYSCGKECDPEDDRCYGCGNIVCTDCVEAGGHELGGEHSRAAEQVAAPDAQERIG